MAEFARDIATDLVRGSGRSSIRLHLDLEAGDIPVSKAPPVALIMNEVMTNALKHAFPDGREGRLSVSVVPDRTHLSIRIADDGVGMPMEAMEKRSFGKRLVDSLCRQLQASIAWQANDPGTLVSIRFPRETAAASESR